MAYLALYRKYRPQTFGEVVGQDVVTRTLKNAVASGRTSHAYLFCGPRGTGKTSTAKILARAVNCENPQDGEPCGECRACLALSEANAQIAGAQVNVQTLQAGYAATSADIQAARDRIAAAQEDYNRQSALMDRGFTTRARLEQSQHGLEQARAAYQGAVADAFAATSKSDVYAGPVYASYVWPISAIILGDQNEVGISAHLFGLANCSSGSVVAPRSPIIMLCRE